MATPRDFAWAFLVLAFMVVSVAVHFARKWKARWMRDAEAERLKHLAERSNQQRPWRE